MDTVAVSPAWNGAAGGLRGPLGGHCCGDDGSPLTDALLEPLYVYVHFQRPTV